MSYRIPFHHESFRPTSIPGNDTTQAPVEFELSAIGGPDLARLKTLLYALGAVGYATEWTPDLQRNVIEAFRSGPGMFAAGVDAIRGLTAPAALAVRVGVLGTLPPTMTPESDVAITTGADFARIAPFMLVLALEVALQIGKISNDAEIDPRFFGSPSGSPMTATGQSGTAASAPSAPVNNATAADATPTAN